MGCSDIARWSTSVEESCATLQAGGIDEEGSQSLDWEEGVVRGGRLRSVGVFGGASTVRLGDQWKSGGGGQEASGS